MGQRLVVTVKTHEKEIAKIYYHWSAYTCCALYETRNVINCIYNHKDEPEKEMLLNLIRFCEANGGGIRGTKEEFEYIQSLYHNETFVTENYSRNNGLIALSESGMKDLQDWSEGDVYINIDTDKVDFYVYYGYANFAEYAEEKKSYDDDFDKTELDDIPKFDFCLGLFEANDIDAIIASLDTTNAHIIECAGEICEIIE